MENETVKLLQDMNIQKDNVLEHAKPDNIVLVKNTRTWKATDIACLFEKRLIESEYDKEDSYQEGLKYELKRILNSREVKVIPVIIGALDMTSKVSTPGFSLYDLTSRWEPWSCGL